MTQTPVITSNGKAFDDPRLLQLTLEAIWPDPSFGWIRDHVTHCLNGSVAGKAYQDVASLIERVLQESKNREPKWSEAIKHFDDHKFQTAKAQNAYQTQGKENYKAVYWPDPTAPHPHGRPIHGELPFGRRIPMLTKKTGIGSAGSCFAVEIKKYLTANGYNYVMTEENEDASAKWVAQYNAVAFQQMIEWAFGLRERPLIAWESSDTGRLQLWDPFREGIFYDSIDQMGPEWERHRKAARAALETMEVLILTLGLIEIWRLAFTDAVLARYPRTMSPNLIHSETLTVEQNLAALERTLAVLRRHNPNIRMIVTVSPVPLYATFQGDKTHVVVATQMAKSVLRVAIDQFAARNADAVTYFPAFETVVWCTKNPWQPDMRHVSKEGVHNVMRLFEEVFIARR